jgi:hypothetical protein
MNSNEIAKALEDLKRLAKAQCSEKEILQSFRMSRSEMDVICREYFKSSFIEIYEGAKIEGQIELRLAQYNAAVTGDRDMLKLLGKEVLGQGSGESDDEKIQQVIILPALKAIGEKPSEGEKV